MIYKKFEDMELSALGFGAMRLPVTGPDKKVDEVQVAAMVKKAMDSGINYYDTAYGYHGGASERIMGKVLKAYPRDSYAIATKFPGYDLSNMGKVEAIFEEQLEKTGMDVFDFYLFHNVCEMNIEQYLDPKNGILDYLLAQKEKGRIRHLGFSCHGRVDVLKRFLDAYGDHMEFCQIQLNYLDWKLQEADKKVALLNDRHIPIWVMEPLRGGKLARLSEENAASLKALRPEEAIPAWAFRFLQTVPGVTMVLSGMSDMEQLEANLATFEREKPLTDTEMTALMAVADSMMDILPCTACRYCISHRSCKLDIPSLLFMYNELKVNNGFITAMGIGALPEDERPSACIACKQCEAVCPQQIKISEVMEDFVERMKGPVSF